MFRNYLNYTDEALAILSPAELEKIIENCFTSHIKHYDILARVTPLLHSQQLCPLSYAIEILEVNAVEVMLNNYQEGAISFLKSYYIESVLGALWAQIDSNKHFDMSMSERKERIKKIAELLFEYKNQTTQNDLENYAKVVPLIDFYKLIMLKGVNLSQMSSLFLPQYDILDLKPLRKEMSYNSVEDVLLMHSYAANKSIEDIRTIYTNLLNNSKIAADIMHFTAINLINGDDLKITFTSNSTATSRYDSLHNIISIGTEEDDKFTPKVATIHELGHYTLFSLFPNNQGMPFDLSKIRFLETTQTDIYGHHLNNSLEFQGTINTEKMSFFEAVHSDIDKFLQYEQAVKQVFIKVGELLRLNTDLLSPYVLTKDLIAFLKDNTLIDLFSDNFELRNGFVMEELPLSRKKSFFEASFSYQQGLYEDTCPNEIGEQFKEFSFEEMVEFVRYQYFPYIIEKFSLNNDKIWFLERIAQLINLGKDIYDCPSSYFQEECMYGVYYQELIIRYAELKANDINQELLDSFSGLVEYWQENITPKIDEMKTNFLAEQTLLEFI